MKRDEEVVDYEKLQILFTSYLNRNDENSLIEITRLTAPWLFGLVFQLIVDENKAEEIINFTFDHFIKNKRKYHPNKQNIFFEIFIIAKELTLKVK